jgi:hypothetical protein
VTLRSAASAHTPVTISSNANFTATPATLGTDPNVNAVTFSAPALETGVSDLGKEFPIPFAIGTTDATGPVLKAKVMKPRIVNLTVWPLRRPSATGPIPPLPTKEQFQNFLNDIYTPQINVTFDVTIKDSSTLPSDPGDEFAVAGQQLPWQEPIDEACQGGDMRLFVLCDYDDLTDNPNGMGLHTGWSYPEGAYSWMAAKGLTLPKHNAWLGTAAHEIGHIMLGAGHPDNESGPAPLPGTNRKYRLMSSTPLSNAASFATRRVLVKAEWDKAQNWLMNRPGGDN